MTLHQGDHFDHYEVKGHTANGGTGDIYRAVDVLTGSEVALKIPMRSATLDAGRYEQFLREIEALRVLHHPAVQHYIESGSFSTTPFLVTEWVEGQSLRHLLRENAPLAFDRALTLMRRIAEGLDYCHQQGVIHRDVKPENVLIAAGDRPIIIDFGLALTQARSGGGRPAGTPDYMAPEQIEGERGDQRTDIYALGTILYEMLAGELPFIGKDAEEVYRKHLYAAVPRLDHIRPELSQQLTAFIARCLQHDPSQRYPDMQAFILTLENLNDVDVRDLDVLTTAPPQPSFFKSQAGQVLVLLTATVLGMALLTIVAVALKQPAFP